MSKSERRVGTVSRGIRCPIIRTGDDLGAIVTESVLEAAKSEGFELRDRDVIAVTESIVARAQGNYFTAPLKILRRMSGLSLEAAPSALSSRSFPATDSRSACAGSQWALRRSF